MVVVNVLIFFEEDKYDLTGVPIPPNLYNLLLKST